MAKNDIVLLDSLLHKSASRFGSADESELFELFSFEQLLKRYEPSIDELEGGWTDGGNDGGIDGLFVFVDERPATPNVADYARTKKPTIALHILSCRRAATFEQQPVDALISSVTELLDLRIDTRELDYPFNEHVVRQRDLFRQIFVSLADRQPLLEIRVTFCTRGDTSILAPNIRARTVVLLETLKELFSEASVEIGFAGAAELLAMARKGFDFRIRLPITETAITREGKNFIVLVTLRNYYQAITDETGALKRYLFESNVRDYLGDGSVNKDIMDSLTKKTSANQGDFWWLNNGVTMLGTSVWIMAKEIFVENAQIVNGLQTTETIYDYFAKGGDADDQRAILLKVIVAADEEMRSRIVKATNYQNNIDLGSLRGLDTIQRNIEEFLRDHGWFYDRRKKFYLNSGMPANRIITIPYLAAAVRAIALGDPARSPRQRSRSLREDSIYHAVFNASWDLRIYLACIEIARAVEETTNSRRAIWNSPPMALSHYISFVYVCEALGRYPYPAEDVIELEGRPPAEEVIRDIWDRLKQASRNARGPLFRGVRLSDNFIKSFVAKEFSSVPDPPPTSDNPASTAGSD